MSEKLKQFKEFCLSAGPFIIFFGIILILVISVFLSPSNEEENAKINNDINKNTKCYVRASYVDPLIEFEVKWKDGNTSTARASSVIYGQADDKIYFLGQFNDTLQALPKIMVEDVKEKSSRVMK